MTATACTTTTTSATTSTSGAASGANSAICAQATQSLQSVSSVARANPNNPDAEERFKECSEAYAVLADAEKRNLYDRFGHAGVGGAGAGVGFDASVFQDFSDIFGEFFGFGDLFGGGRTGRRTRPCHA